MDRPGGGEGAEKEEQVRDERTRSLLITGMTKLTRHHLLQLEGSSTALPFCRLLTTWQVCDVRRAADIDSLEIPSYQMGFLRFLARRFAPAICDCHSIWNTNTNIEINSHCADTKLFLHSPFSY